jgi:hypothetical protein
MEALMKYQLVSGLSVGQFFYAPGQIIDTSQQAWAGLANVFPPSDAVALDQSTYSLMTNSGGVIGAGYPYWTTRYGPGVVPIHG